MNAAERTFLHQFSQTTSAPLASLSVGSCKNSICCRILCTVGRHGTDFLHHHHYAGRWLQAAADCAHPSASCWKASVHRYTVSHLAAAHHCGRRWSSGSNSSFLRSSRRRQGKSSARSDDRLQKSGCYSGCCGGNAVSSLVSLSPCSFHPVAGCSRE